MQKNSTINSKKNTQSRRKNTNSDLTRFDLFAYVLGARKREVSIDFVESIHFFSNGDQERSASLLFSHPHSLSNPKNPNST